MGTEELMKREIERMDQSRGSDMFNSTSTDTELDYRTTRDAGSARWQWTQQNTSKQIAWPQTSNAESTT